MMTIRPQQQGQGCESACGSPSPVPSASLAAFWGAGTLSSGAMFSARPPLANGADRGVGDTGIKRRGTELGIAIQYSVLENQVVDPIIVTAVSCSKHRFWGKGSALGLLNRENPVTN
jgi:hypothetical protein